MTTSVAVLAVLLLSLALCVESLSKRHDERVTEAFAALQFSVPESAAHGIGGIGGRHKHSFQHSDAETGHVIELEYDVAFRAQVVLAEHVPGVLGVAHCDIDSVELHVDDDHSFDWSPGHMLTSNAARCASNNEHVAVRILRVLPTATGGNDSDTDRRRRVRFETEPVGLHEMLDGGSVIHFHTNKAPPLHAHRSREQFRHSTPTDKKKRDALDRVGQFLVDTAIELESGLRATAKAIVDAAKLVEAALKYIFTGYVSEGPFYAVVIDGQWNYNPDTRRAAEIVPLNQEADYVGPQARCVDCYFQFDTGFLFRITVEQHSKLSEFALLMRGDVRAKIDVDLAAGARMDASVDVWSDMLAAKSFMFQVGPIPVIVDYRMDVTIGFRGTLVAVNAWHGTAQGFGCAELGFELNKASGVVEPVDRLVLAYNGSLPAVAVTDVSSAALQVFIKVLNYVRFQRIGGPYIRVTPFLEVAVAFGDVAAPVCGAGSTKNALSVAVNWGTQVAIGGFLRVALDEKDVVVIYEKVWEPTPVLSVKDELWSTCLSGGANGKRDVEQQQQQQLSASALAVGRAWFGAQKFCVSPQTTRRDLFGCTDLANDGIVISFDATVSLQLVQRDSANSMLFTIDIVSLFGEDANPIVPSYGSGLLKPRGDEDGDGVLNADDLCSKTSRGVAVLARPGSALNCMCWEKSYKNATVGVCPKGIDPARVGCAEGQQPDIHDVDRDTAGNNPQIDRCPYELGSAGLPSCSTVGASAPCLDSAYCQQPPPPRRSNRIKCWLTALYRAERSATDAAAGRLQYTLTRVDNSGMWPDDAAFMRRCTDLNDAIDFGPPRQLRGTFTDSAFVSTEISSVVPLDRVTFRDTAPSCRRWSLKSRGGTASSVVATARSSSSGQVVPVAPPAPNVVINEAFVHGGECRYADQKPNLKLDQVLDVVNAVRKPRKTDNKQDVFGEDKKNAALAGCSQVLSSAIFAAATARLL